jgi:hypothetical protein
MQLSRVLRDEPRLRFTSRGRGPLYASVFGPTSSSPALPYPRLRFIMQPKARSGCQVFVNSQSQLWPRFTESTSVARWIWPLARLRSIIPCPVSIHSCEQSRRHPGGAGVAMSAGGSSWDRFLVWKVFRQKGWPKNSWRKCNGARALKSKQSLLQLHNWPSTHTDVPLFF